MSENEARRLVAQAPRWHHEYEVITARARRSLTVGDSYTCTYCLQVIKWDHHRTRPTKDHFFPKSKKKMLMGAKTIFVICCQPCNSRKSDKVFSSI